jgi:single-stranded-DNA-specific exonuclease
VDLRRYLDIVTIGTVADMVPLTGVNRPLVVSGLKLMGAEPTRPGVVALKEVCGMAARPLEAGTIAFHLAPRLNAAGRLGSAQTGIELLMAPGYAQALPLARKLDEDNRQRQQIEAAVVKMADDLARDPATGNAPPALVLASPQWHIGVLGIVASRLVEKHYRPTVLLNVEGDEACGSARSIPGFNIGGALESCSSLLMRHGGHAMAAGLSLATANIDALRERLQHLVASTLSPEDMTPVLKVDAVLPLRCVTSETLSDMERLAPFGMGNPEPVLASPDLRVIQKKLVGSGEHLKLVVESEGRRVEAIGYRLSRLPVEVGDVVEAAFIPEMRTFLGVTSLQLRLKDVRRNGGA